MTEREEELNGLVQIIQDITKRYNVTILPKAVKDRYIISLLDHTTGKSYGLTFTGDPHTGEGQMRVELK
jgi:hypothetical protein